MHSASTAPPTGSVGNCDLSRVINISTCTVSRVKLTVWVRVVEGFGHALLVLLLSVAVVKLQQHVDQLIGRLLHQ